mmetsp:Transcript_19283/g.37806  ORF Transcript_19283/g.37806 Transcript_19283/m.37806 type:complete len:514 (-) Transcript_19283:321-1862(-)|eukprot:CAMPEP_0171496390 /NCGR_PEP_ID=MMETSP0958-20121227/6678_1 /TAXON_ID=87120 /ORGANISM="Aurantiochytrium limacinum, Strain ATCCMYA-1381" /LENGTH=513 /DNA_ID=CAMNT_0012030493 /DNA_START=519 /DNA_END=2060 /DNA_ORIENTATION=+
MPPLAVVQQQHSGDADRQNAGENSAARQLGALGLEANVAGVAPTASFAALLEQFAQVQRQVSQNAQQQQQESRKRPLESNVTNEGKADSKTDSSASKTATDLMINQPNKALKTEATSSPKAAVRQESHSSASGEDDDDDDDDDDDESGDEGRGRSGRMKGRFSQSERRLLFGIIREDPELLRSFLHQLKRRIWDGKSWMHEIGTRFNKRAKRKRSHDAVRHHLKLRRPQPTDNRVILSADEQELADFLHLLEHSSTCSRRDACARCLQLSRLRVRRGLARCGYPGCDKCDPSLPHVLDDFDVRGLLRFTQQQEQQRQFQHHHHLQRLPLAQLGLAGSMLSNGEEANSISLPERRNQVMLQALQQRTDSNGSANSTSGLPFQTASALNLLPHNLLASLQQQQQSQQTLNLLNSLTKNSANNQQQQLSDNATIMRLLQEQRERQTLLNALLAANASNSGSGGLQMPMTPVSSIPSLNFISKNTVNPDPKVRPTPRAFSDFEVSLAETLAQASKNQ